jgi:hypothetical protein
MKIAQRYIYPPRPMKEAIPFSQVKIYSQYGWVGQVKYNDKRTEISVSDNGVEIFNRHNSTHKTFTLSAALREELLTVFRDILGLDVSNWSYLDGGILDGKNKHISGLFVIWDILVREGDWLVGSTYQERYNWLLEKAIAAGGKPFIVTINGKEFYFGVRLSEHVFLPRVSEDFNSIWEFTQAVNQAAGWSTETGGEPVLEGIIAKDPNGVLKPDNGQEKNNTEWSARSRVRTGRHRN